MSDKLTSKKALDRASMRKQDDNVAKFEYEATQTNTKRKNVSASQRPHQDIVFSKQKRKKGERITQDVLENIPLAGWMIRRHLDAVSSFYVEVDSAIPKEIRDNIEMLFKWHGKARNFDAARRHSIDEAFRLFELNKVIDGDSMMVKINRQSSNRYGAIQLVEGSRIARPNDLPGYLNVVDQNGFKKVSDHGLELDEFGGVKSYIVCKYNAHGRQLVYDRRVLARDAIYSGYFNRYSQTRGESPLMCAVNQLMDIKEGMEYILLKIKLHALFGYAIQKEAVEGIGDGLPSSALEIEDQDPSYVDENMTDTSREVDISSGPFSVNLMEGEKIQTIESETPPESVKDYTELAIRSALLALDIPFSFFDATGSNFAKVIADRKMYEISAESKRAKNMAAYEQYVDWKLDMWTRNGDISIPYNELRDFVHVRATPTPWLDKESEIAAEERAIALGLKSIPDLGKERGVDVYEVLQRQSEFLRRAEELDVPVYIGDPGARSERDNRLDNEIREQENEMQDEQ
jgi:capsid protein